MTTIPSLQGLFKEGAKGAVTGVLDGAASIIGRFKADPTKVVEAESALEQLRVNSELRLQELDVQIEEAYLKDTQSAREQNMAIQNSDKASWLSKNVAYMIDIFLTILWGAVTTILFLKIFKITANDVDMVSLMALHGTATAVFMTVLNFHRGTSRGSEDKQKHINEMMKGSS